ncbi:unnamed protein product, partial [Brassica napus]
SWWTSCSFRKSSKGLRGNCFSWKLQVCSRRWSWTRSNKLYDQRNIRLV